MRHLRQAPTLAAAILAVTATAAAPAPAAQEGTRSPAPAYSLLPLPVELSVSIGIILAAIVITWVLRVSGRRSAETRGRRSMVVDACARGSALHDAISVAELPGVQAAGDDADARRADIQRRADRLRQTLNALRVAVPGEEERARVVNALAALQAVQSAMEAEHVPYPAAGRGPKNVRTRLRLLEVSLRALRGPGLTK